MINFKEFLKENTARQEEIERHQAQQRKELKKFNNMLDAWKVEREASQY